MIFFVICFIVWLLFSADFQCLLLLFLTMMLMLLVFQKRFIFGLRTCDNVLRNAMTHIFTVHVNNVAYEFVAYEINMNLFPSKISREKKQQSLWLNIVQQHLRICWNIWAGEYIY